MNLFISILGKIRRSPRTIRHLLHPFMVEFNRFFIYVNCRLRKKINVVFLVEYETSCKWDKVYERLSADSRFVATILVCPRADCDEATMIMQQDACYKYFISKGYNVLKAYNCSNKSMLDIKTLYPNVVFLTNPYPWISQDQYYIDALEVYYPCYISYNFNNAASPEFYDSLFHRKLWRYYLENDATRECFTNLLQENRKNYKVVGYPAIERFRNTKHVSQRKLIIWAPHHTLMEVFGFLHRDSFLRYNEFMLRMAEKYRAQADFVFRPHPLLRERLYGWKDWGKQRTDEYYDRWNKLENGRYSLDDDYMQLFSDSDALIHDCASFTIEYLFAEKPALFTGDRPNAKNYISTTNAALDCYEFAHSEEDIEAFILRVLNNAVDPLLGKKRQFKKKYMIPLNGCKPSENIVNDLLISFGICKN